MNKNLLTLVLLGSMLFSQSPVFANEIESAILRKAISLRGRKQEEAQRTPLPAQAYLTEYLLTIDMYHFVSDITITITDMSTDEIVYEQTFKADTKTTSIDLSIQETGDYKIELSSANWLLYGDFSL